MVSKLIGAMPWWVWLLLAAAVAVKVLGMLMKTARFKGWRGEKIVGGRLRKGLGEGYIVLDDIYLPTSEGRTTQIDHVVISQFGIFAVETKMWTGWIFGDRDSPKWTQCVHRKKNSFQNPIRQNYRHICELARNLGIGQEYFRGVVAITGDCEFKTKMPEGVVFSRKAAEYIRSFNEAIIKASQVKEIAAAIVEWNNSISAELRANHVKNLKESHPRS